jgi:hypothetical protein
VDILHLTMMGGFAECERARRARASLTAAQARELR